ncbi:MAG: hypothetical protein ACREKM_03360 [Longimicrobiales bacterium]
MAEIHVEKKRGSMGWLWMLVLLIALALLGWWLWQSGMLGGATDAVVPGDTLSLLGSALPHPYA